MVDPIAQPARRTLTPAVLASALFAAACAVVAITFGFVAAVAVWIVAALGGAL